MLYLANAGNLADLDGATLTLAVFTDAYVPSAADTTLTSIAADEVDLADAPGYVRGSFIAEWDATTSTLHVDNATRLAATLDLAGATVRHYVVATAAGSLISWHSLAAPTPGADDTPVTFPQGIVAPADLTELLSRIAAAEADLATKITVTGTPADGQAPIWNDTDSEWQPGDVAGGGASGDSDLTVTATAAALKSATVGDTIEDGLIAAGVSSGRAATERAVIEGFVVTADGSTQDEINDNASAFLAYSLASAAAAQEAADLATLIQSGAFERPDPAAYTRVGYGDTGYGTSLHGHWQCSTLLDSPTTSFRVRALVRIVTAPTPGAGNEFQEWWSEEINGGADGADRYEAATFFTESRNPTSYWEKTPNSAVIEDVQDVGGPVPASGWFEAEIVHDLTANTVTHRLRSDQAWDHEAADGTLWLTTKTTDYGASTTINAGDALIQWIGRGAGAFDIGRVRVWLDGTAALDANFTAAADGATTIDDAVLESSPGTPAEWVAQENAEVHETPAAGAVDSVNGATGTVVLDAADVGAPALGDITAKGDLYVGTGSGTIDNLAVGADGRVPIANANESTGIAWALPASTHMFASGAYTANGPYVSSTVLMVNNRLYLGKPFVIRKRRTFSRIAINHISGLSSTGVIRLGLYVPTEADGLPGALLAEYGTVDATTAAAIKPVTTTITLDPGVYFPACVWQGTGTAPTVAGVSNALPPIYPDPYAPGSGNTMPMHTAQSGAMPDPFTSNAAANTSPVIYLYV